MEHLQATDSRIWSRNYQTCYFAKQGLDQLQFHKQIWRTFPGYQYSKARLGPSQRNFLMITCHHILILLPLGSFCSLVLTWAGIFFSIKPAPAKEKIHLSSVIFFHQEPAKWRQWSSVNCSYTWGLSGTVNNNQWNLEQLRVSASGLTIISQPSVASQKLCSGSMIRITKGMINFSYF